MELDTFQLQLDKLSMKKTLIILALVVVAAAALLGYRHRYAPVDADGVADCGALTSFRDGQSVRCDTASQRILLIGDSMAYSLMFRVKNYCDYNGHALNVVSWVGATSKTYAECDTLSYFIDKFDPTYIIFVIGANELFAYNGHGRDCFFDALVPQTRGIPTVWIGPPNWAEDTGINDVMMKRFGPRQFFLSKNLHFTRVAGDVAHPDRASGTMWMDSISTWIMRDSYFPIRLERPVGDNPIHVDFVKLVKR